MNHDESGHFSSNKRPQIEIQFGNPEAANSTAKPEAAANTPNDSVIDRVRGAAA